MAETSRSRVTITLGRSGQVVKRSASDASFSDSFPAPGTKHSVRDRLGFGTESQMLGKTQLNNKRQCRDAMPFELGSSGVKDVHIDRDDLRYKLIRKKAFREAPNEDDWDIGDLRKKLSKTIQPLRTRPGFDAPRCMDKPKPILEARDLRQVPPSRSTGDLPKTDSRRFYSAWTLDHLRRRSPDGILSTSRGISTPRSVEDPQRGTFLVAYDDARSVSYMSKNDLDRPRPVATTAYMTKSVAPIVTSTPALTLAPRHLPPPYTGNDQPTVDGFLHSLGLQKYVILFKAEEVDMTALKQMGENDLKELGIPMGGGIKLLTKILVYNA